MSSHGKIVGFVTSILANINHCIILQFPTSPPMCSSNARFQSVVPSHFLPAWNYPTSFPQILPPAHYSPPKKKKTEYSVLSSFLMKIHSPTGCRPQKKYGFVWKFSRSSHLPSCSLFRCYFGWFFFQFSDTKTWIFQGFPEIFHRISQISP